MIVHLKEIFCGNFDLNIDNHIGDILSLYLLYILCFLHNHRMTHKEIAEKLNVSPQTVNYRIGQALKLLRIALKDYLPLFILYFGLDIFKQS